jgi:uncharacterized protein YjbI with pentapeptide repeats
MEPLEPESKRRLTVKEVISGISIGVVAAILLYVLWRILNSYIDPGDDPTLRKDVVQAFAVIVGGLVAFGTLLIGWRNLRHNQRTLLVSQQNTRETLRNAQEVENRRAQDAALQSYFEQMGDLLLDKELLTSHEDSEVRILAQAQTHTVLPTLNSERKRSVLIFLYRTNLLNASEPIITLERANLQGADLYAANFYAANLQGADLRGAVLQWANLQGADLQVANLQGANLQEAILYEANLYAADLQGADLRGANLQGANLQEADLQGANLQGAQLADADVSKEQLGSALSIEGATMPDGSVH